MKAGAWLYTTDDDKAHLLRHSAQPDTHLARCGKLMRLSLIGPLAHAATADRCAGCEDLDTNDQLWRAVEAMVTAHLARQGAADGGVARMPPDG